MMHRSPAPDQPAWHAMPATEAMAALASGPDGLSTAEAQRRLGAYGPNRLARVASRPAMVRLLLQFHNLLIYVLLGSAGIALLLGHLVDALVILAVVVANALIGFVQEGRLRGEFYREGSYHDLLILSIFRDTATTGETQV